MSTVLTIYNQQSFCRQLLPSDNNVDYYFTLAGKKFCLKNNLQLHLEIINKAWRVLPGKDYLLFLENKDGVQALSSACPLKDGMRLLVQTPDMAQVRIRVRESEFLRPYQKVLFPSSGQIRIGTDSSCDIRIPGGERPRQDAPAFEAQQDASVSEPRQDAPAFEAQQDASASEPRQDTSASGLQEDSLLVRLSRKEGQTYLENLSGGSVFHNMGAVRGLTLLTPGDVIDLSGGRLVWLGSVIALEDSGCFETSLEAVREEEGGEAFPSGPFPGERELYRRSPRRLEKLDTGVIEIESPPDPFTRKKLSLRQMVGNSVLMVVPMLAGSLMMIMASRQQGGMTSLFMYSGLVMAVSSVIVGIIWAVISARGAAAEQKAEENHRFEAYSAYLITKADEIRGHYLANKERLQRLYPDSEVCLGYSSEGRELWNRNYRQDDFLKIRTGLGNIPFQMEIHIPEERFSMTDDSLRSKPEWIRENYQTLYDVPVLLDLKEHSLCALVGGEEKYGAFALMRTLALHLAATHCYTDLKLVFLYDSGAESEEWEFAKWLPHVWSEDRKIRYTAGSRSEISDVCYELTRIFQQRMERLKAKDRDAGQMQLPHFVLFLSDPRLIEGERISPYVYKNAEKVGLSTFILSDYRENLPNECSYFLDENDMFEGISFGGGRLPVAFDRTSLRQLNGFARRIAGVRVKETSSGGEIPSSVSFLEMYKVSSVEQLQVKNRWLKNRTYDNIRGLLGLKGGDEPLYLDLHEKYHGPHGLVAGTTGSGKSETLQTYLLSLAVEYSPDDISFFVIDYKGGGMANLFEGLPHLTGFISNLSGPQIYRALVSIKAENRRRQQLFNAARVNNINRYTHLYKEGLIQTPIPHLLIVIDEFAELKKEEPDFMRELISVAQVGRSLGVHLILSTQKPSGTVDDNIWSNSNFRLCLRVQTVEDSVDMLGTRDAAYITQAGRGYLQVGNQELYEMFQSGYSGAPYAPDAVPDSEASALISLTGRAELRYDGKARAAGKTEDCSQLDAVREYLIRTAGEEGYAGGHQLWMPTLANPVYLENFEAYSARAAGTDGYRDKMTEEDRWDLTAVIGQTDDPQNQEQKPLMISLADGGNHAVIGSIVSGKSTLLQTIVYSLVTTYTPAELNVYAIDYSGRFLAAFESLAHTGGVMFDGEEEKTERFFLMLSNMLEERKKKYRGGNYAQYVKAHGTEDPAILLVIDNFGAFQEKTGEKYLARLIALSKEGVSNGIFLLISAGGFGMNELPNRLAENMGTVLTLALPDRFAYADVLRVTRVNLMPETQFRGRGLCRIGDQILEYQAALALPADDDFQRMESIRRRCESLNTLWSGPAARRIPEIPENPLSDSFLALPQVKEALQDERFLPVGYRKDNAEICSLDFRRIYCCLIAGLRRSGKTSLLRLMILEALQKECAGIALIDLSGKLKDLYGQDGLKVIADHDALYDYCMNDLTPVFKERNGKKHELIDQGLEEDEYYEAMSSFRPVFVFITDLVVFLQEVYADSRNMKGFMETLFRKGEDHKISFIAALPLENRAEAAGFEAFSLFTQYRTGVHMGGNLSQDPYLSFDTVGFKEQSKTELPGIAMVPEMGTMDQAVKLVVPYAPRVKK